VTPRLVVLAKAPLPGRVKTRLIPALGPQGAARLAARMLDDTLARVLAAGIGPVELCTSPAPDHGDWSGYPFPAGLETTDQGQGDLGERMARAAKRCLAGGTPVLLLGTDCPALSPERLRQAAQALDQHDAVLYPARDGGYTLLGLRRYHPSLFEGMPWSTPQLLPTTLATLRDLDWHLWLGETLSDIDEPGDLYLLPEPWRSELV